MKIGVHTAIGRLDKYDYQYTYDLVLDSLHSFADEILITSTSNLNQEKTFKEFPKVKLISNEKTWFEFKKSEEVFSFKKLIANHSLAFESLKERGFDVCVNIHINQYIPASSVPKLRAVCANLIKKNKPFDWLYKKNQLKNILLDSDTRLPWILNLKISHDFRVTADSITNAKNGEVIAIEHGDFRSKNDIALIDPIGELTMDDLKEKHCFTIGELSKLNKNSQFIFDEDRYLNYAIAKMKSKRVSNDQLCKIGKKIVERSKENFLSNIYIKYISKKRISVFEKIRKRIVNYINNASKKIRN